MRYLAHLADAIPAGSASAELERLTTMLNT